MTSHMMSAAARGDEKLPAIGLDLESPISSARYVHLGLRPNATTVSTFEFTTRFCLIQTETGLNSNVEERVFL